MKAVELIKRSNLFLKIVNKEVSNLNYKWPDKILLTACADAGDKRVYIYYFDFASKEPRNNIVPNNFELEALNNDDKFITEYQEWAIKNLLAATRYSGMVGADPEIFVKNKESIIPAFNFLSDKKTAHEEYKKDSKITNPLYWDGFQAEFTTNPTGCLQSQVDEVYKGMKLLLNKARTFDANAKLAIETTVDISQDLMDKANDEQASFGCMPSLNVYGLKGPDIPGREVNFRSAGGHIHFGIGKHNQDTVDRMVKALDAILGIACVSLFADYDNPKRRQLYGMPGEYRLPEHGLEYRTLSNAWMCHPVIMHMVFDLARKALMIGQRGLLKHWDASEADVIEVIQTCNVKGARSILDKNKDLLLKIFQTIYIEDKIAQKTFDIFRNGLDTIIFNASDIEGNWLLEDKTNQWCHFRSWGYIALNPKLPVKLKGKFAV